MVERCLRSAAVWETEVGENDATVGGFGSGLRVGLEGPSSGAVAGGGGGGGDMEIIHGVSVEVKVQYCVCGQEGCGRPDQEQPCNNVPGFVIAKLVGCGLSWARMPRFQVDLPPCNKCRGPSAFIYYS